MSARAVVVILNWRGWRDTIECLESVLRLEYAPFQVVVCDNASDDGSMARIGAWADGKAKAAAEDPRMGRLSSPPVPKPVPFLEIRHREAALGGFPGPDEARLILLHSGGNRGFAGGNNVAIRYALSEPTVEYVWLLNNDTVVDPPALANAIAAAEEDPRLGVVGSRVNLYHDPERIQAAAGGSFDPWRAATRYAVAERSEDGAALDPLDYVTGSSMLVRAEAFRSVGLLDERYFLYYEEVDWCLRARRAGWKLGYAAGSVVWHKDGRSVGARSARADYYSTRSALLLTQKFYAFRLPAVVLYTLYRNLAPKLARGQLRRAGAVLRAYRDFLRFGKRNPEADPSELYRARAG